MASATLVGILCFFNSLTCPFSYLLLCLLIQKLQFESIIMRSAYTLAFAGLAAVASATCESLCAGDLTFAEDNTSIISCTYHTAGSTFDIEGAQSACASSATPEVDLCRIVLSVATSSQSETYIEVWLPSGGDTSWNGRMMSTDNGGVGGCKSN